MTYLRWYCLLSVFKWIVDDCLECYYLHLQGSKNSKTQLFVGYGKLEKLHYRYQNFHSSYQKPLVRTIGHNGFFCPDLSFKFVD